MTAGSTGGPARHMAMKRPRTQPQRWSDDPLSVARLGGSQVKLEATVALTASSVSPRNAVGHGKVVIKTESTPRLDGWAGGPLVPIKKERNVSAEPAKQERVVAIKKEEGVGDARAKQLRVATVKLVKVKAEPAPEAVIIEGPAAQERRRIATKQAARKRVATAGAGVDTKVPSWAQFNGADEMRGDEPYPSFKAPSPESCAEAVAVMADDYGLPSADRPYPRARPDLLDALVGTILSQNTTDTNSRRAFASLKQTLPTWKDVLDCDQLVMIEAIRSGGLAEIKTGRIIAILELLVQEGHVSADDPTQPSLDYLWELDTASAKAEIVRFNVSCRLPFRQWRKFTSALSPSCWGTYLPGVRHA